MGTNKHIKQEDWNLLAQTLFENPVTKTNDKAFQDELTFVDANELKKLSEITHQVDLHFKLKKYNRSKAFQLVKARIQQQNKTSILTPFVKRMIRVAAVIAIALLIGSVVFLMSHNKLTKLKQSELVVASFGLSQIELSDGSLVTLNQDSKINYPNKFGEHSREISIEGEAFFEITANPQKPFIIHAGEATIKVLGTSFTVNAYPENDLIEVIVESGKVKFSKKRDNEKTDMAMILDPGEKGIYVTTSNKLTKCMNNDPNFLAWKTHELIFLETSLAEVIKQLNKVYRVKIRTTTPELENLLLNAHFKDESLDFILEIISSTHGLEVKEKDGYYLLKEKA